MRLLIAVSVVLSACGVSAGSEQLVLDIHWRAMKESGRLSVGELQRGDESGPDEYLVVTNTEDLPMSVGLLTLTDPGITATDYALTGLVSYEGVRGIGYLEMWNHFTGGGAYFSKTLGESGPMGSLQGTSNWREFSLPFLSNAETGVPNRLEFNLVLPGPGTVKLGPVRLVQYPEGFAGMSRAGAWWSERTAGWIGAIGGTICGCLGALIGTLNSLGRARRLVVSLSVGLVAFGVVCLAMGGIAWLSSQPYAVYYPLLLGGVICTAVFGGLLPQIVQRYRQLELRKMMSMDVDSVNI